MIKYILILWLYRYNAAAVITQEFYTKENCEKALYLAYERNGKNDGMITMNGVCVEK